LEENLDMKRLIIRATVTGTFLMLAGCTTPEIPGPLLEQNVCILEGPLAVMPVVYRTLTYTPEDALEREMQVNILAAVARSFTARLLEGKGIEVIDFPELDNRIAEVTPDYWSEESRAPEKLRLLAENTGAKTILFLDLHAPYSYKRMTVLDYLSYQAAAPDIMGVPGYMEVYDYKGEPIRAFAAVAEIPAETSIEALSRSVFCIGANYLFHVYVPPKPSTPKGIMMPGQMIPFSEISADRALYTEAKAIEVLIGKILSACLGIKDLGDLEHQSFQVDQSLVKRSWYSIDVLDEPAGPIPAPKGSTIGIFFAPYSDRTGKVIDFTQKGASKYIAFSQGPIKKMQQKIGKARTKYESQLLQELIKIGKEKGYTIAGLKGEDMWPSGLLQDTSSSVLTEKARNLDCDILILVKTKAPLDARMTRFETSVKILDISSGRFRKDFFGKGQGQIAMRVLNSAIVPSE